MRANFVKFLEKAAEKDKNIFVLTGDLGKFFNTFKKKFPKRFINCGVAEENMIGVAAGLALSGKNVYCYSIIPFLVMRTLEKIRIDLCLHNLNVKLLGAGGGLCYGLEGPTHQAVEDIAIMRSLPNMAVVAPGDLQETKAIARASVNFKGPLYIRFGRDNPPQVHKALPRLKIGQGIILKEGEDVALLVTGTLLYEAKLAAENLQKKGFKITLVSMPTIKPINALLINKIAKKHRLIFTLEDHSKLGGFGSAVAEVLQGQDFKGVLRRIALRDEYPKLIAKTDYLYQHYGLDALSIIRYILKTFKKVL